MQYNPDNIYRMSTSDICNCLTQHAEWTTNVASNRYVHVSSLILYRGYTPPNNCYTKSTINKNINYLMFTLWARHLAYLQSLEWLLWTVWNTTTYYSSGSRRFWPFKKWSFWHCLIISLASPGKTSVSWTSNCHVHVVSPGDMFCGECTRLCMFLCDLVYILQWLLG